MNTDPNIVAARKRTWRRYLPGTIFMFLFGIFCVAWGATHWDEAGYIVIGLANLIASAYFARHAIIERRQEHADRNHPAE